MCFHLENDLDNKLPALAIIAIENEDAQKTFLMLFLILRVQKQGKRILLINI